MIKHTAVYVRVSSDRQLHRSQLADLKVWKEAHDTPTREYRDKVTGKTMDRPGWSKLWADVDIQTDTATTANVANRRLPCPLREGPESGGRPSAYHVVDGNQQDSGQPAR
jgi:hypothetical protein